MFSYWTRKTVNPPQSTIPPAANFSVDAANQEAATDSETVIVLPESPRSVASSQAANEPDPAAAQLAEQPSSHSGPVDDVAAISAIVPPSILAARASQGHAEPKEGVSLATTALAKPTIAASVVGEAIQPKAEINKSNNQKNTYDRTIKYILATTAALAVFGIGLYAAYYFRQRSTTGNSGLTNPLGFGPINPLGNLQPSISTLACNLGYDHTKNKPCYVTPR